MAAPACERRRSSRKKAMLLNAPPPSLLPPAESAQCVFNCFLQRADPPAAAMLRFGLFYLFTASPITPGGLEQRDAAAQIQRPPLGTRVIKRSGIQMAANSDDFALRLEVATQIFTILKNERKKNVSNIFHGAVTFVSNGLLNNTGRLQFVFSHLDLTLTSLRELHITNITNVAQ